jgi:hypothetical protein
LVVGTSTTTSSTTTTSTTTTTTEEKSVQVLMDSHRFLLCSCCELAGKPSDAAPVKAVDTRVILWWAIAAGCGGIVIAGATGAWYFRPASCRGVKASRVAPIETATGKLSGAALALEDVPALDALSLSQELEVIRHKQRSLMDTQDTDSMKLANQRELEILAHLGQASLGGPRAALALEDFPAEPESMLPGGELGGDGGTTVPQTSTAVQQISQRVTRDVRRQDTFREWQHW